MAKKNKKNLKKSYEKDLEKSNGKNLEKKSYEKYLVYLTFIIVVINAVLVYYMYQSNERMARLFVGQNKPLIGVTPISITQVSDDGRIKMAKTKLSVVNYSGFVAHNIIIDFRYVDNIWLSEWLKADHNRKKGKLGVVLRKEYLSVPEAPKLEGSARETFIKKLCSGGKDVTTHTGQFDLEKIIGGSKDVGHTILVRVTWENDNKHVFDEIHKYKLLCTKSVQPDPKLDSGLSFTFIPEGIISQKN